MQTIETRYNLIDGLYNFRSYQPENISVKIVDETPPEAKVYFDKDTKQLKVEGIDNLLQVSIERQDRLFLIKDGADNTLTLVFEKLKQEKREIKARLESLQYNGQPKIELPETKLHFEWSLDKRTGEVGELEQKIEIKHQFKIRAKYRSRTDETKIRTTEIEIDDGKQKQITKQALPGLVTIKLITKAGVLGFEF